eukprot:GHVN01037710.1.p2 GENE.GHVN01037710.1~~GHVN01037710.1.p2  ORF type:complete len:100 (-),score=34.53 GHVN01037710.1:1129-1428(-)
MNHMSGLVLLKGEVREVSEMSEVREVSEVSEVIEVRLPPYLLRHRPCLTCTQTLSHKAPTPRVITYESSFGDPLFHRTDPPFHSPPKRSLPPAHPRCVR